MMEEEEEGLKEEDAAACIVCGQRAKTSSGIFLP